MNWEPWTGCYSRSLGCGNCYFYGPSAKRYGQSEITNQAALYCAISFTGASRLVVLSQSGKGKAVVNIALWPAEIMKSYQRLDKYLQNNLPPKRNA